MMQCTNLLELSNTSLLQRTGSRPKEKGLYRMKWRHWRQHHEKITHKSVTAQPSVEGIVHEFWYLESKANSLLLRCNNQFASHRATVTIIKAALLAFPFFFFSTVPGPIRSTSDLWTSNPKESHPATSIFLKSNCLLSK